MPKTLKYPSSDLINNTIKEEINNEGLTLPSEFRDSFILALSNAIHKSWEDYYNGVALPFASATGLAPSPGGPTTTVKATISKGLLVMGTPFNTIASNFKLPSNFNSYTSYTKNLVNYINIALGLQVLFYTINWTWNNIAPTNGQSGWYFAGSPPVPIPGSWSNGDFTIYNNTLAMGTASNKEITSNGIFDQIKTFFYSQNPKYTDQFLRGFSNAFKILWDGFKLHTYLNAGNGIGITNLPTGLAPGFLLGGDLNNVE